MKKILGLIMSMVLGVSVMVCVAACGGDKADGGDPTSVEISSGESDGNSGGNGGTSSGSSTVEARSAQDKTLLESGGYSTTLITSTSLLGSMSAAINAESGDIVGILNATNAETGTSIYLYYFADRSKARTCYKDHWEANPNYHLDGDKIIYDNGNDGTFTYDDQTDKLFAMLSEDASAIRTHGGYYVDSRSGKYDEYLDSFAESQGITRDDLYGIVIATSASSSAYFNIYYFMDASTAQRYYNHWSADPSYSLLGVRVIVDPYGVGVADIIS